MATHWAERWIGRQYDENGHDCAALCCDVRREVFGGRLPPAAATLRADSRLQRSRQIEQAIAEMLHPTESPQEGDVVLMKSAGRLEHVGVFCRIGGDDWVLHALFNAGHVVLHRLRDLAAQGLKAEGFYAWKP